MAWFEVPGDPKVGPSELLNDATAHRLFDLPGLAGFLVGRIFAHPATLSNHKKMAPEAPQCNVALLSSAPARN
jgi:hypothetical protein